MSESKPKIKNDQNPVKIQIQPIQEESKLPLTKIVSMIISLSKEDSVKKAKIIEQSRAVKKLLDKKDYTSSDKTNLRKIFYDSYRDDDYDKEEAIYNAKMEEFGKDPDKKNIKKMTLQKEARDFALFSIIEEKKALLKSYLNADTKTKSRISKSYRSIIELSTKKLKKVSNSKDPLKDEIETILENGDSNPFISVENFEAIIDPENKYQSVSKNKESFIEYLKEKKKDKFKDAFDYCSSVNKNIFIINKKLQETKPKWDRIGKEFTVENVADGVANDWKKLDYNNIDINSHLVNFMNHCVSSINNNVVLNPSVLIELTNIMICILNRIKNLEEISGSVSSGIEAMANLRIEEAKIGFVGKKEIDKRLMLDNYLKKNNKTLYSAEDWKKLSAFQKIKERFQFRDYSLNPPHRQWEELTNEEKKGFLELKIDYINKRIVQIKEIFDKKSKIVALRLYDNLKYYYDKDSFGFKIEIDKNLLNSINMDPKLKEIKNQLDTEWEKASREGSIVNMVYFERKRVKTFGQSAVFFVKKNERQILQKSRKFKNNNNNKFPFLRNNNPGKATGNKQNKSYRGNYNKFKKNNGKFNRYKNTKKKNSYPKKKGFKQKEGFYWAPDNSNNWPVNSNNNNKDNAVESSSPYSNF